MPRSSNYRAYPPMFTEAVEKIFDEGVELKLDFDTAQQARAMQQRFYGFFGAVRKAAFTGERTLEEDRKDLVELFKMSSQVELVVRGPRLILRPRNSAPEIAILEAAMRNAGAAPQPQGIEDEITASLARLSKLTGQKLG